MELSIKPKETNIGITSLRDGLKQFIEDTGMTKAKVAQLLGLANSRVVTSIIDGKQDITLNVAYGISRLLNLSDEEKAKLEKNLGGIKEMKELPGAIFIIDTHKEQIAVAEARRMGIPIIAVVDTNCNPEGIDFPIPGNDDAIRAISLFTSIIANAVIESDNEAGLKILENLNDDEEVTTDAAVKNDDEEIVDYSNYQPTEAKEEAPEADDNDSLVDEDKVYKD